VASFTALGSGPRAVKLATHARDILRAHPEGHLHDAQLAAADRIIAAAK
jgi:hypothetical protein